MPLNVQIDDDLLDCLGAFMKDEGLDSIEDAVNEALADYFEVEAEEEVEEEVPLRNRR